MKIRLWRGYLALGLVMTGVYFGLSPGAQALLYLVVGFSAVVAVVGGTLWHRAEDPAPWLLFGGGQLAFFAGDAAWELYRFVLHLDPFPSVADVFYLSGYPLFAAGLVILIRRRCARRDWASLVDASILTAGMAVVCWTFLMQPYAHDSSLTFSQRLVSIGYPLGDLLLLAVAARLLVAPGAHSFAYRAIGISLVFQLGTDIAFGAVNLFGSYSDGNPLDAGWLLAYVSWGTAALHPSMRSLASRAVPREVELRRSRLAVLCAASLTAPAVLALQTVRDAPVDIPVVVAGSVVLFLLVLVRMDGLVARQRSNVVRESILRQAAAALVAARGKDEAHAATLEAAARLAPHSSLELSGSTGGLLVRSGPPLPPETERALETLSAQATLALESAELAERLHAARAEARFRSLVQNASDVIAVVDPATTIAYLTPSVATVLGYDPEALVGTKLLDLVHPQDAEQTLALCAGLAAGSRRSTPLEVRIRRRDGTWRDFETIASNLLDDPSVGGIVLASHDVTDRNALEQQLTHQAFHDPLTGLANRALFANRAEHALSRRAARHGSVAVLFLDLDDFKTVNDSLGHDEGDRLLAAAAERLRGCVRPSDTTARLGGDEFAILLDDLHDASGAAEFAKRIGEAFSAPFSLPSREVFVRTSVGVALGRGAENAVELLRNADVALYHAKAQGKGCCEIFQPGMHAAALARLELRSELERAVEREEFVLEYQPIVDLQTGTILGAEALVRWEHPSRGRVPPLDFIPLAEETGLILPLGRSVLRTACRQAREWRLRHPATSPRWVSVNLSARQVREASLADEVTEALAEARLEPGSLMLEITETVLMHHWDTAVAQLERLRALGVRIAVDDFGTGYSSLSQLRRLPVDVLKIAKPFVDEIATRGDEERVAAAILEMGSALRLTAIAEGIELPEQADRLTALGCELGQGFHFSGPLSVAAFENLLEEPHLGPSALAA